MEPVKYNGEIWRVVKWVERPEIFQSDFTFSNGLRSVDLQLDCKHFASANSIYKAVRAKLI
jgi:hypothetical protein